jgi:hypothetical protein
MLCKTKTRLLSNLTGSLNLKRVLPVFKGCRRGLEPVVLLEVLALLHQRRVEEWQTVERRLLTEQRRRRAEHRRKALQKRR